MARILFLPFLQIPSGHHHVADSIKVQLEQDPGIFHCDKVDILSYSYGKIEQLISAFYIQWIHTFPSIYSQIYRHVAVRGRTIHKHYYTYEWLFMKKLEELIEETRPDLVICTHALPSYLLARLKERNIWSGKVMNVYTDYFVNDLWGIKQIDFHFVPSMHIKKELLQRGVKSEQIFVTGIPIHPLFQAESMKKRSKIRQTLLLSGGNMGAGSLHQLLDRLQPNGSILYKVLCGKNEKLFQSIERLAHPLIQPLPFISTKAEMNRLYDEADGIITKPGGVTISESLNKNLPIFVYDALPGQEEMNLQFLKTEGLIFHLENWHTLDVEAQIVNILQNEVAKNQKHIKAYLEQIEKVDSSRLIQQLLTP